MVEVDPVLPLPAEQRHVLAVDDDHVVPHVRRGVVDWLVLALQDLGHRLHRGGEEDEGERKGSGNGRRGKNDDTGQEDMSRSTFAEWKGFCHLAS